MNELVEIERKFLVDWSKRPADWIYSPAVLIQQAYIATESKTAVRVRTTNTAGYLTIKGENVGMTRFEAEYEIPLEDAKKLIETVCDTVIEKFRFTFVHKGKLWEVDHFIGDNYGLNVAEIELESEHERFDLPRWIIEEVTGEDRYYNSNLATYPFKDWM